MILKLCEKANSKLTKKLYKAGEFDPLLCPSMIINCPRSTLPVKTLKPNLVFKKNLYESGKDPRSLETEFKRLMPLFPWRYLPMGKGQ